MVVIALLLSVTFFYLAGLHVYWARGGYWPGTDTQSLLARVVGVSPSGTMPGPAACLVVTTLLSVAALIPLALLGWVPLPWPLIAAYGCAAVLILRGVLGYVDHLLRPGIVETPFFRLNRWLYSPLCLLLGSSMLYLARHA